MGGGWNVVHPDTSGPWFLRVQVNFVLPKSPRSARPLRMTAAELIALAIQLSIGLIVASVALNARLADLVSLCHRPGLLVRSLLSMFVVMPALAVGMALLFDLRPVLEAALIALALAPVPPLLPRKEIDKAGGAPSYTVGLLAATALVSIAFVPAALAVVGHIFHRPVHVEVANVAKIVATSIFVPFLAGLAVRRVAPAAARLAGPLALVATVLLVVIVSSVVSLPYVKWRARGHARSPSQERPRAS